MIKSPISHFDIFDKEILEGTNVAFAASNQMRLGVVIKLNKKMIRIKEFGRSNLHSGYLKYPREVVVVSDKSVTMYLLKHSK